MNLGCFGPTNGRFVTHICLSNKNGWNPYFYSVFWVRAFWAKVSKKELLKTHQKREKMTDNWKALSLVFLCCFFLFLIVFFLVFLFLFFVFFFFFVFFVFFVFGFFLEGLRVRWGGPKGQLTWPQTVLIYLFFVLFLHFSFLSLLFSTQKNFFFAPRKGHFLFCFWVSLFVSSQRFLASPFLTFLFLCLTFVLVPFSSFLSFFLLSFGSCFCLFLSFSFFFALNNIKIFNCNFFFINFFSLLLVFCLLFLFQIPFSYLCYFLILSYVFVSTSMFLVQNKQLKKNINFWSKRGLQQNVFVLWTCVLQNVKSYRFFGGHFFGMGTSAHI